MFGLVVGLCGLPRRRRTGRGSSSAATPATRSTPPSVLLRPLRGLFGRRAGTLNGFDYSTAMREAGQRASPGRQRLDRFLVDPEEMIAGVRMGGVRLRDQPTAGR
jgi:hypothetical protein